MFMRVLPALIHRNLSPSSRKTDINACMMPMIDARSSESCSMDRLWAHGSSARVVSGNNNQMPCEHGLASVSQDKVLSWGINVR